MRRLIFVVVLVVMLVAPVACAVPPPTPTPSSQAPSATKPPSDLPRQPAPTAVAPTPTSVSRKGGDFREAAAAEAKSFHPYQTTDTSSRAYQDNVYANGLFLNDPKTLQPIPGLAESWTVSADARVYVFKLRKDVKWSDGAPLTARDFAWTYQQASKPENKFPYIENFKDIVSYAAVDDYTIEVVLKEGTCAGLSTADAVRPLPRHVWEKLDWGDPTKNPEIQQPSVVSGPYKVKEWRRDDHVTFVRNDLYYRGAPNFDTHTIRIIPNPSVQFQMLKTGEVDQASVSAADYDEARRTELLKEYDWDPALALWTFIGFNLRRPLIKDVEVRHALSYAMPRQAISDKVFNGLAKPLYSFLPASSWAYEPEVPRYDYSIETAKSTLARAGYKLDSSGKLLDKDGRPAPRLKVLFPTNNKQREQVATIAQEEFRKLGIESEVVGMEWQAYLTYIQKEPFDYDLFVHGWRATLDPYFMYQAFAEANVPAVNRGAYVNKEVERLFDQSNRPACDLESRKKAFSQVQKILAVDSPYIFLTYSTGYQFLNKRVVPNETSGLGINYYLEQWYFASK